MRNLRQLFRRHAKSGMLLVIVLFSLSFGGLVSVKSVNAYHNSGTLGCGTQQLGRCQAHGYFTNQDSFMSGFDGIFSFRNNTDYQGISNADDFISTVKRKLNKDFSACANTLRPSNPTSWAIPGSCFDNMADATQAAFFVHAMFGTPGSAAGGNETSGVNLARNKFAQWESLVRTYNNNGWISFNTSVNCPAQSVTWNTTRYGHDVGWLYNNCGVVFRFNV